MDPPPDGEVRSDGCLPLQGATGLARSTGLRGTTGESYSCLHPLTEGVQASVRSADDESRLIAATSAGATELTGITGLQGTTGELDTCLHQFPGGASLKQVLQMMKYRLTATTSAGATAPVGQPCVYPTSPHAHSLCVPCNNLKTAEDPFKVSLTYIQKGATSLTEVTNLTSLPLPMSYVSLRLMYLEKELI